MAVKQPKFSLARFINQHSDLLECDLVNCDPPDVPHCEDGETAVLKNPGECQPIHECGMTSLWYLCCVHAEKHGGWRLRRCEVLYILFP